MKKIALVLAMLIFAAPAMAALSVGCQFAGYTCSVTYFNDPTGDPLPRAFALDISLGPGSTIKTLPSACPTCDFYIYPDSIDVNETTSVVDSWGSPVVTGSVGGSTMTVAMSSLYATNDTDHPTGPSKVGGTVVSFEVHDICAVEVKENVARAGVVMEDGSDDGQSDPVSTCDILRPSCWSYNTLCYGDADGTWTIGFMDGFAWKDAYLPSGTNWNNGHGTRADDGIHGGDYNPCADFDQNGSIGFMDGFAWRDTYLGDTTLMTCSTLPSTMTWPPSGY